MKIFTPEGEEVAEFVQPIHSNDYEVLHSMLDGTPRKDTWNPIPVRIITKGERRRPLRRSDAPSPMVSDFLVFRLSAANVLSALLGKYGEVLPLKCEQAELVAFNALRVIDALDEAASVVERFSDGRIMWVDEYVFRKEAIQGLQVFKVTSLQPSPVFVGEEFVKLWRAAKLEGLDFRQVWEG